MRSLFCRLDQFGLQTTLMNVLFSLDFGVCSNASNVLSWMSESAARKKSEAAVLEEERRFRASFESPETARALAAAASYLQSNPSGAGRGVDEAAAATVASAYIRRGVESQLSPASTSSTVMVPKAERGGDQQPEANARSCSSPCEWFVSDEEETATRIFAIQVRIEKQLNKSCSEANLRS
jgi:hypothetical protein